jgi:hypothetical protein
LGVLNHDHSCSSLSWASNGDSQNPCQIWATLGFKCGTFNVPALTGGTSAVPVAGYPAPSVSGTIPANDCQCNLVAYNLMAACSWCQEGVYSGSWVKSQEWAAGCTNFNSNGVATTVNTTGLNIPPYAVQAPPGPWWDPTDAQKTQETFGSNGSANSTNSVRNAASASSMGTMVSLHRMWYPIVPLIHSFHSSHSLLWPHSTCCYNSEELLSCLKAIVYIK